MDFERLCPQCGKKRVYFSHEIGQKVMCASCGHEISLATNRTTVALRFIWLLVVLVALASAYPLLRLSVRAVGAFASEYATHGKEKK